MSNRVLLAVHDKGLIKTLPRLIGYAGYQSDLAKNKEDLLEKAKQQRYHACIMDVNFERPQSFEIGISKEVYKLLNQYATTKFMAISGDPKIVEEAKKQGIPTVYKSELDLLTFLRQ
jgi:hypothetical protein